MTKASAVIAGVVGAATLLPLLPLRHWWIRIFDFPRVQIAALAALGAIPVVFSRSRRGKREAATVAVLGSCLAYQLARTLPYTSMWSKQVQDARAPAAGRRVTLLLSNVLMTNRNAAALVELVRREQPDILLAVEADRRWEEQLRPLRAEMPHTVSCPLENT